MEYTELTMEELTRLMEAGVTAGRLAIIEGVLCVDQEELDSLDY